MRGLANVEPVRRAVVAATALAVEINARRWRLAEPAEVARESDAPDASGVQIGSPPADQVPACMPPIARLVAQVAWSSSPMHSRVVRYHACCNRDRNLWLLWQRPYDTKYFQWKPARIVAHAERQIRSEDVDGNAEHRQPQALWTHARDDENLDHHHELT